MENEWFIVGYALHRHRYSVFIGSRNSKRAPAPFWDGGASSAAPPASCIRLRTIARPSPVPRCRVVKNGSQMLSLSSDATPGPLSWTTINNPLYHARPKPLFLLHCEMIATRAID